jgi:flagellar hook-length control protein FliK
MPTSIKSFVPVQSTPPPFKPLVESRPRERKEDFQQHLDDAATTNKPAESTKPTARPAKAESKKPAGKSAESQKARSKTDRKGDAESTVEGEVDAAEAPVEGAGDAQSLAEADAEAAEAEADEDHAAVGRKEDDGESGYVDEDEDSAADAAALAQAAAAVQPVTASKDQSRGEGDDQQGATGGASTEATIAIGGDSGKRGKGLSATQVKAAGKEGADGDEDAPADGSVSDPTDALVDAVLKASGGEGADTTEEGTGEDGGESTPAMKKAVEAKPVKPELGLQQVEPEHKAEKPAATGGATNGPIDPAAVAAAASQVAAASGQPAAGEKDSKSPADADVAKSLAPDATAAVTGQPQPQAGGAHRAGGVPAPQPPPEVQFADTNHDSIVTGVKGQLLPHGGSMQIRLDPPELGALKVMVEMRDGAMTATFQTSNEDATRLLSHSLNQLKHVLEGQGVNVERLQVQQAPKGESGSSGSNDDAKQQQQQQNWQDEHAARQEQQRKEVLRRMWRRVSGVADPVDVTA